MAVLQLWNNNDLDLFKTRAIHFALPRSLVLFVVFISFFRLETPLKIAFIPLFLSFKGACKDGGKKSGLWLRCKHNNHCLWSYHRLCFRLRKRPTFRDVATGFSAKMSAFREAWRNQSWNVGCFDVDEQRLKILMEAGPLMHLAFLFHLVLHFIIIHYQQFADDADGGRGDNGDAKDNRLLPIPLDWAVFANVLN